MFFKKRESPIIVVRSTDPYPKDVAFPTGFAEAMSALYGPTPEQKPIGFADGFARMNTSINQWAENEDAKKAALPIAREQSAIAEKASGIMHLKRAIGG